VRSPECTAFSFHETEAKQVEKKLYRVRDCKVLAGVCGGIGAYFNVDPTLIRVAWALLAATGSGVLAYLICALVIPQEP
jgi:phage shock protein PspC (stress-responsive transcriptional regulator)